MRSSWDATNNSILYRIMKEFLGISKYEKKVMRSSKKAKKAYALAIVNVVINTIVIVYLIITK